MKFTGWEFPAIDAAGAVRLDQMMRIVDTIAEAEREIAERDEGG